MPGLESVFKQKNLGRLVFFSLLTILLLKVKDYVPAVGFAMRELKTGRSDS